MYVVTFYSFKGGVGRSMALANVAVDLAQKGRRVLVVDFDLEAPGIDTLALPRPKVMVPGIVEFVSEYLLESIAPDVADHVFEAEGVGRQGGKLWIMPSGIPDDSFAARLNTINWPDLYANRDGYLLFEDLKTQWQNTLAPDYVFIDSRTGHTDVSGICTRQLPDAVALFFIPNEQNLRGLQKVVKDIRSEKDGQRKKRILLHFVMSNVPDIDDEDEILSNRIRQFSKELEIDSPLITIHRYDSLLLLNQAIFTRDRPRSRLAKEYRELSEAITAANSEDRTAALYFLGAVRKGGLGTSPVELLERLRRIREKNAGDGEILFELARVQQWLRRIPESLELLDETIRAGLVTPRVLIARAEARLVLGDAPGAIADAEATLKDVRAKFPEVDRALRLTRQAAPEKLVGSAELAAVTNLPPDERRFLAVQLRSSRIELTESCRILRDVLTTSNATLEQRVTARGDLAFALIGLRDFSGALDALRANESESPLGIVDAFNTAMAEWGLSGAPSEPTFRRVIKLDIGRPDATPNYLQCMAIAYWAAGDKETAIAFLSRARSRAISRPASETSCWRYLYVSNEEFLSDLAEMEHFFAGAAENTPRVFGSAQMSAT